jgi:phospholipid/cholesterol/gamma-HCH transport system substrate-binding protein
MITRRVVANLVSFFVLSAVLIGLGVVNLLGDPLRPPTVVSTVLPDADGLYPGFTVTLNGVAVGSVDRIGLTPTGARVSMAIDAGRRIPDDVAARVEVANALGQQQIDLVPQRGGAAPPLAQGAVIPVAPGGAPADIGQVIATATGFLRAIPVGSLNTVLRQTSVALDGEAGNLHTIIAAGQQFSQEFLQYQQQFSALLSNAPPVLDSVTAAGPALQRSLANTAVVLGVLSTHQAAIVQLLDSGAQASSQLGVLVQAERPNLACIVHDLGATTSNLSVPANLSNLGTALATNNEFFGAVNAVATSGPARSLTVGGSTNPDQLSLRTRLLLPPVLSPAASTYASPRTLPPVRPGAACSTEFGPGVPAATQPGFTPAVPGVVVDEPTAADARVRGSGSPIPGPPATAGTTAAVRPAAPGRGPSGGPALPLMGAGVLALPGPVRRRWRRRGPRPAQRRSTTDPETKETHR